MAGCLKSETTASKWHKSYNLNSLRCLLLLPNYSVFTPAECFVLSFCSQIIPTTGPINLSNINWHCKVARYNDTDTLQWIFSQKHKQIRNNRISDEVKQHYLNYLDEGWTNNLLICQIQTLPPCCFMSYPLIWMWWIFCSIELGYCQSEDWMKPKRILSKYFFCQNISPTDHETIFSVVQSVSVKSVGHF